jgi:RNA polymerase sigma factor (sigma-70 family)
MKVDVAEQIERLYRDDGPKLWRALFAWSGDPEVASDALAEAFMQLLRRGEEVRQPKPWVWRSAFRIAAGDLHDRRRRSGSVPPDAIQELPEQTVDLTRALAALPNKQRASVILHHYAGYSVKEIAQIIGSTPAAVRVHLSAGRKRLRMALTEQEQTDEP